MIKSFSEIDLQSTLAEVEAYDKNLSEKIKEALAQVESERQVRQNLYNLNPNINIIVDSDYNVIDCNPSAIKFYGFDSKEEFKKLAMEKLNNSVLVKMHSGFDTIPINRRFEDVSIQGETSFDTMLSLDGEEIPCHFDLKMIPYQGEQVIAVYQTDLRDIKRIQKDLEHRDKLLSTIYTVAAKLISADDEEFATSFGESIAMLGESINVERVGVWKNHMLEGELYCRQIKEWQKGAEIENGEIHAVDIKYSEFIPTWEKTLPYGKCINAMVKDLAPVERDRMTELGIVSNLSVPLFVKDIFWGFVGFDDCVNERVFTEIEENALGAGAMLIAATLFRNEVTNNLIVAREEALSSARAKSAFLANMSHEIRTPLNAIVGMANIARGKTTDEDALVPIDEILGASKHLMDLINDILDFSKIESGKMELLDEEFDLGSTLYEIPSLFNPRCVEKNILFETNVEKLPRIAAKGDKLRIKQVLINLLGNAVKFTDNGGRIQFFVENIEQTSENITLKFIVSDNGIGITEEQLANLFTAFEQGDSNVSIKYGGTGLGLAISQNIIKMMGGEIFVDSAPNEGSTFSFTITLPTLELSKEEEKSDVRIETMDLSSKRILLAEDIEINRIILSELLSDTKVIIEEAIDGQKALQMFEQSELCYYDLVFLDIQMPNMDGYQTATAIRSLNRDDAREIPIIAMTANAYREDIERALESGMNDHLSKPIDIIAVKQLLFDWLG